MGEGFLQYSLSRFAGEDWGEGQVSCLDTFTLTLSLSLAGREDL